MKSGETLEAKLLYAVYADNRIAIPAGSTLYGHVVQLRPDRSHRIHSRLWGDFTPYHIPTVQFDRLVLPDGLSLPIVSDNATDGAPILTLTTPSAKGKTSVISRQVEDWKRQVKDQVAVFTAPGKGDRALQFLYKQLPYHPERLDAGTAWTVELAQPLTVPPNVAEEQKADPPPAPGAAPKDPPPPAAGPAPGSPASGSPASGSEDQATIWHIHAYLQQTVSSADAKPGDTFEAVVAEPVWGPDHTIAVPQGATLIGAVTQAKPARSFSRRGKLRFAFHELKFPDGFAKNVEGNLSGVDSDGSQGLQLDSEGGVQPQAQNRIVVPLVLSLLASRAFDQDGSQAGNGAVASNGFGLVGRITGIVASSRNVAAGIGFYAAALSFYSRWLARGKNVVFVKNTRIEVATMPGRSPMNAPNAPHLSPPQHR